MFTCNLQGGYQQTVCSLNNPFSYRDFPHVVHQLTARGQEAAKQNLSAVRFQKVQWARSHGSSNVPIPTFGEIVVFFFCLDPVNLL